MGVHLMGVVYFEAFRFSIWGFWEKSLHLTVSVRPAYAFKTRTSQRRRIYHHIDVND